MGWAWGLGPGLKILPTTLIPLGWLQHDQGWDSTFQLTFTQTNFYLIREAIESYRPFPCSQSGICIFAGWPPPKLQPPLLTCKAWKKPDGAPRRRSLRFLGTKSVVENQPGGSVFSEQRHSGLPHRAPREEGEEHALFSVLGPGAFWGQEHSRCNFAADLRDQRVVGEPEASWGSATFAAQHCPLVSRAKTAPLGGGNLPAPWLGLTFSFFRPQALF